MPVSSRWNVEIPGGSLPRWTFGSSFDPLPDTPLFVDPEKPDTHVLSKSQFRLWSKRFAIGLIEAGLQPGDRVLLFSGNTLFTPVVFMGVLMAGGVFTGANPSFVARELAYQLKDSGASFLVSANSSMDIATEAAAEVGLPKDKVYSFDATALDSTPGKAPPGAKHWTDLLVSAEKAEKWDWYEAPDSKTATCCLNYSSGTTGVPKGVQISHYSYIANGIQVLHVAAMRDDYEDWVKRSRQLCFLPMYHAFGQTYFTTIFPKIGIPVYIMGGFDFVKMLEYVQKYRITSLTCVPPIVVALAKHPLARKYDLSSIESLGSGAAPLTREVAEEAEKLWPSGDVLITQGWGMTEVTCTCLTWHPGSKLKSIAVGELTPNCRGKIMRLDGSGEITTANESGEIWVTGPTLMQGYWNKPEATANTLHIDADGTRWLKTGDIAFIEKYEQGGLWHVIDRLKELIKVKGNQVAPAELEGVLLENKSVIDAAVVGVTINGEEVPRAYVVPNPAAKVSEQDIAQWMQNKVVRYKWLKGGVIYVPEIPKNPSGKILRKELRDRAAKEVGDKKSAL
ncbi:AMP-binding enzyme [Truncatella angustata]|uniref:AMP-binding enzyme n=1 Tax=Truncatella angustata TaxID=152316 RepID=A0A9P8UNI7_9PEZI|nr:AMP-binding enzyme [Truncatella angustata]KAH6655457.1 AMP-binding enzyme [Truncatella angustata]